MPLDASDYSPPPKRQDDPTLRAISCGMTAVAGAAGFASPPFGFGLFALLLNWLAVHAIVTNLAESDGD